MNIYRCWHQGIRGYSCRVRDRNWMFVPDVGQPDNHSYRNLDLMELDFKNKYEKKFEMNYEASMKKHRMWNFISNLMGRNKKPASIYGRLFLPD